MWSSEVCKSGKRLNHTFHSDSTWPLKRSTLQPHSDRCDTQQHGPIDFWCRCSELLGSKHFRIEPSGAEGACCNSTSLLDWLQFCRKARNEDKRKHQSKSSTRSFAIVHFVSNRVRSMQLPYIAALSGRLRSKHMDISPSSQYNMENLSTKLTFSTCHYSWMGSCSLACLDRCLDNRDDKRGLH